MKHRQIKKMGLLIGIVSILASCQTKPGAGAPLIGAGVGAAIGASAFEEDKRDTGLALGALAGYGIGKFAQNRKVKKNLEVYNNGYEKGKSDSVKTLYWANRNAERADEEPPVEYRYYEVPIAEHVTSDGVVIGAHRQVIEVFE